MTRLAASDRVATTVRAATIHRAASDRAAMTHSGPTARAATTRPAATARAAIAASCPATRSPTPDSDDLPKYQVSDAPRSRPPPPRVRPWASLPLSPPCPRAVDDGQSELAPPPRVNGAESGESEDLGDANADAGANGNEIYVSVGRRDGAKPSDYQAVLEAAGIGPDITEYVRVRHRHAFVGVRGGDQLDRVIAVLNGATIAGRRASAERAPFAIDVRAGVVKAAGARGHLGA
jgi:hypothetical protein